MTREEAKELLPIIQAFADGNTIEFLNARNMWEELEDVLFCREPKYYRIKPEPKYRPFINVEECWQEMQKHQPFGWLKDTDTGGYIIISELDDKDIEISGNNGWDYAGLMKCYTFADGTPFGIKEE